MDRADKKTLDLLDVRYSIFWDDVSTRCKLMSESDDSTPPDLNPWLNVFEEKDNKLYNEKDDLCENTGKSHKTFRDRRVEAAWA